MIYQSLLCTCNDKKMKLKVATSCSINILLRERDSHNSEENLYFFLAEKSKVLFTIMKVTDRR